MHGAKASEQLLAEHPLVDFLLEILNIAEVQDVILKYVRHSNRKFRRQIRHISDFERRKYL
jgi:hypothetical protein